MFVLIATGVDFVLQILLAASFAMQWMMLLQAQETGIDMATAQANDVRQQIVSVLVIVAALVSLVALLVWIYAAHANLPALGAGKLEFTPGWAVGYFFIPIVNLWKPFQAVREIHIRSDPDYASGRTQDSAAIVGWWWGLRIVSAIAGRVLASGAGPTNTIEGLITLSAASIFAIVAVDLPLLAVQFLLIQKVQRFQTQRHALVEQQAAAQPAALSSNPFAALS